MRIEINFLLQSVYTRIFEQSFVGIFIFYNRQTQTGATFSVTVLDGISKERASISISQLDAEGKNFTIVEKKSLYHQPTCEKNTVSELIAHIAITGIFEIRRAYNPTLSLEDTDRWIKKSVATDLIAEHVQNTISDSIIATHALIYEVEQGLEKEMRARLTTKIKKSDFLDYVSREYGNRKYLTETTPALEQQANKRIALAHMLIDLARLRKALFLIQYGKIIEALKGNFHLTLADVAIIQQIAQPKMDYFAQKNGHLQNCIIRTRLSFPLIEDLIRVKNIECLQALQEIFSEVNRDLYPQDFEHLADEIYDYLIEKKLLC